MKLRGIIPRFLDGSEEDSLLAGMQGGIAVSLLGEHIGTARVLDFTDVDFEVEIEIDDGVDLHLDVGTYVAAPRPPYALRYTLVWWGDGYLVYDGDTYIGKDDQVDFVWMMETAGVAEKIDAEEQGDVLDENWGVPLPELKKALGA